MAQKIDLLVNVDGPNRVIVIVNAVVLTPDEARNLAFQIVQGAAKAEELSPIHLPGKDFPA